ncbi:hypothetical protein BASA83_007697 [Batrachochytrium salamandrivorans]|nr:hypothetical protein BASA83_007697 [Batrachochytrium salamandrivorans]
MDSDIGAESDAVTEADVETSNNAEAGAGASSDDSSPYHPSGSGELSELDQTSDSTGELYWPSQEHLLPHRQRYIRGVTKNLSKKPLKK